MFCFLPEDNLQFFGISLSQSKQQYKTTVLYTQTMKHVSVNNKCCKSVAQSVPGGKPYSHIVIQPYSLWHNASISFTVFNTGVSTSRHSLAQWQVVKVHSCQPLLGVNLSPESVDLYFPYAGWCLLFFRWWPRHFEFQPARVAVEGRSNVVRNTHAWLQISLLTRFLSLLH